MKKMILLVLLFVASAVATVSDSESIRQYFTCGGSITTFTFTFKCNSSDDVLVYNHIIATGDEGNPLTEDTDYTIAATSSSYLNGGVVTISPALESTSRVVIVRNIKKSQETSPGAMSAAAAVLALDKLTRVVQDLQDRNDRSWHLQESDATSFDMGIPGLELRAESYPYFDISGNITYISGVTPDDVGVTPYMETLLDDSTVSTARGTLGLSSTDTVRFADIKVKGPVVDVRAFEATGDDDSDDTDAIKLAIAYSSEPLYFPDGTFLIDESLTFTTNRQIILSENTIIRATDNACISIFTSSTASLNFAFYGNGGLLDCNNKAQYGIRISNADNVIIRDFRITDYRDNGVSNTDNINTLDCDDVSVSGCRIDNATSSPARGHGIIGQGHDVFTVTDCYITNSYIGIAGFSNVNIITECTIDTMDDNGIYFIPQGTEPRCIADNCTIISAAEGVVCAETGSTIVSSCTFKSSSNKGVSIRDSHNVIIDGCNFFEDNSPIACRSTENDTPTDIVITSNIIEKPGDIGIFLNRVNDAIISSNIIKDFTDATDGDGIRISYNQTAAVGSTGILITTNNISDSSGNLKYGIAFSNAEVTGNIARNNQITGTSAAKRVQIDSASLNIAEGNVNEFLTFTDASAQPLVFGGERFFTGTTGVTITRFSSPYVGQVFTVISKGTIIFDVDAGFLECGTTDLTTASGDVTMWICETAPTTLSAVCRLISHMDNAADQN